MGKSAEYLNRSQIEEAIPHKGNSVFLEKAVRVPNVSARATLGALPKVTESSSEEIPQFVLIEGMAQILALIKPPEDKIGVLAGINNMSRQRRPLKTEEVEFEAIITRQRGNMGKGHVLTRVKDEVVMEGDYIFAIVDLKTLKST